MNQTNINVQLLTIEAARTRDKNYIYQAAMLDPHTAAELNIDDIRSMCMNWIEAHGEYVWQCINKCIPEALPVITIPAYCG